MEGSGSVYLTIGSGVGRQTQENAKNQAYPWFSWTKSWFRLVLTWSGLQKV
jgi:hypothetical protein